MEEIKVFSSTEIGFIGNGAMCKAILTGIIKSKLINPANIGNFFVYVALGF